MTKEEIMEVREHMESIRVNCEAAITENPVDEYAQSNWQHVMAALELLRTQKGNPASAENGKKGGRPRKVKIEDPAMLSGLSSYIPGIDGEIAKRCAEQLKKGMDSEGYYTVSPDVYAYIIDAMGHAVLGSADEEVIDGMLDGGEL